MISDVGDGCTHRLDPFGRGVSNLRPGRRRLNLLPNGRCVHQVVGLALARRLGQSGARLVLADIEADALDRAVDELSGAGVDVIGVRADVATRVDIEAVGAAALERFGALHLAVNNAGVAVGGASWTLTEEDWRWVLGVDLWGVIHGVSVFTPLIIESGGGHIVNTASMAGLTSTPFMGPYNVAKHGVVTLSETLAVELAMLHPEVGVTVVCPGWVRTGINRSERNRPVASDATDADALAGDAGLRSVIDGLIATGLEPDEVAGRVLDAVLAGRFSVLTHDDWSVGVTRRAERLVAGDQPEFIMPSND